MEEFSPSANYGRPYVAAPFGIGVSVCELAANNRSDVVRLKLRLNLTKYSHHFGALISRLLEPANSRRSGERSIQVASRNTTTPLLVMMMMNNWRPLVSRRDPNDARSPGQIASVACFRRQVRSYRVPEVLRSSTARARLPQSAGDACKSPAQ